MMRRMGSALLAGAMCLSLLATSAMAAPEEPETAAPEETVQETVTAPETPAVEEDVQAAETGEEAAPQTQAAPRTALRQDHMPYMGGFPEGTFQPDGQLTRAQGGQVIWRLLTDPTGGTGTCSYLDVPAGAWYAQAVEDLCALGIFADGDYFRPEDIMTRAEFVTMLVRLVPQTGGGVSFPDVPAGHWAAQAIEAAAGAGWISGYEDGCFRPEGGLSRAEACTILNRVLGRPGDEAQGEKLMGLGLFSDVKATHWGAGEIAEAAVSHTPVSLTEGSETWAALDLAGMTFAPGVHAVGGQLYSVDRYGKLALNRTVGAYTAGAAGELTRTANGYQMPSVPYISQIDNIYAWVGCEAVATLMGLQAKGYATNVGVRYFLDNLPRAASDPEKGFVGSPYVPDSTKRTRTTIYPAKLAQYSNSYCGKDTVCQDFRGASITQLQQELLAGNCVVGYMTLWWEKPYYRNYNIEGTIQRLVSNNHAVLVCGYDPDKGYYISDPYNYYNRGEKHQYWENAQTFERIWNERKVGMVLR